jgi:hypothetical protein
MPLNKTKHRRLQFSLRFLLLFVLVVSIPLAWFGAHLAKARRQQHVVAEIKNRRGSVTYDDEYEALRRLLSNDRESDGDAVVPSDDSWQTRLFGYDYSHTVASIQLSRLSGSKAPGSPFRDDDLRWITELRDLQQVSLRFHPITDEGLQTLTSLAHLKKLCLYGTDISDAGLPYLVALKELESLDVGGTRVSVPGVVAAFHSRLRELHLSNDQIEAAGGWDAVKKSLPGTRIWEIFVSPKGDVSVFSK